MNKNLLKVPFIFLVLLVSFKLSAQSFTLTYNFANVTSSSGRTDPTPPPTATGLAADSFRAVGALSANSGAGGRFSFSQWPTGATSGSNILAGSLDPTKYYEVKITPITGYELSINSINFIVQRSATGVRQWAVRSSADGFAANLPASIDPANTALTVADSNKFQIVDRATTTAQTGSKVTINNITNVTSTITLRFYGFNAEGTGGTFSLNRVDIAGATVKAANAPILEVSTATINFPSLPVYNVSQPKTYTIKGESLTGPVTINTNAPYFLSVDNNSYSTSISLSAQDAASDKTIYVKFSPTHVGTFSGLITHSSAGAASKTITVSGDGIDPANLSFNFDSCTAAGTPGSGFTAYNVAGPQTWTCSNFGRNGTRGVDMNGFAGGSAVDNEDWLISPRLIIRNITLPILRFWSRAEFTGPQLQLLVSTNYDGSSDPNTATWTELDANFPSNNNTWTLTDGIDLSPYKNFLNVYIAFKYTSSVELGSARWSLDDIDITNRTTLFIANPSQLNFGEATVGTTTKALPFTVKAIGYGDIRLTAPSGYQLSLDSVAYATSISIPATTVQNDTKVYARFAPEVKALKVEGMVRFTGTGLDSLRVLLTGTSYPKAETFDVGTYNLSFFGSNPTNNPTAAKIATQVTNVATVVSQLNLDVLGVQEVSSDTAFNNLVRRVPNRNGILSNRWSYSFDPADPNFPPQKVGFIFDSSTTKLIDSRVMFERMYDSVRNGFPQKLPNYPGGNPTSFWASGRLPYIATFDANINGIVKRVKVIVIHAKSASDAASYNRRVYDVKVLKDTLDAYYKGENIILLGDYNDRVINSIYAGSTNSPYKLFVDDNSNYTALTLPLDQAGRTSFIGGSGLIDHITISNNLFGNYISNSTEIEDPRSYVANYNATTASDHLPVYTRFAFAATLPVTLTKFNAQPKGADVLITWTTANELNSSHFIVERSTDGRSFSSIGSVKAAGYLISSVAYNIVDRHPFAGLNYYRLKQVDVDGKFTYSNVVTVNFTSPYVLSVYPNPVTTSIQIKLNSLAQYLVAQVTSAQGVVVMQAKGDLRQINQQINQKLSSLSSGMYVLKISNANENHVTQFIKK